MSSDDDGDQGLNCYPLMCGVKLRINLKPI